MKKQKNKFLVPQCLSNLGLFKKAFTLAEGATHVGVFDNCRRCAFTLAEVLITLGIIGIVAAMTIPTLIQDYNTRVWNTSATVFNRKLEEALKTMNLLTQVQSLMDSGMSKSEVETLFPDLDFSTALDQLASLQQYLNINSWDTNLSSLQTMFGEALPDEMITLATDLDMTCAQARWDEFASNPGAITTDAVIEGIQENEKAQRQQIHVDAVIDRFTETPEGADKTALSPEGLIAYVQTYAEATSGADVSGLTPENIVAIVAGY